MIGVSIGEKNELDLLPYEGEWFSIGNVYAKKGKQIIILILYFLIQVLVQHTVLEPSIVLQTFQNT